PPCSHTPHAQALSATRDRKARGHPLASRLGSSTTIDDHEGPGCAVWKTRRKILVGEGSTPWAGDLPQQRQTLPHNINSTPHEYGAGTSPGRGASGPRRDGPVVRHSRPSRLRCR